jgi:signal peptidase I
MIIFRPNLANVLKIGGIGIAAAVMYLQPYRPLVVVGRSMEPNYHDRSLQWTEPLPQEDLRRGQVVEINMPTGPIIKRIAYLEGDKIPQIYIGKQWMDMLYVRPSARSHSKQLKFRKFVVPHGTAYVLGDNQVVSFDSRNFGCIPTERIQRILVDQEPPIVGKKDRGDAGWN